MKTKRILAILLTFVMTFAIFPITPLATEASPCNGNHTGWTAIDSPIIINSAGKYYLTEDIENHGKSYTISITCSGEVTLCLNSKKITNTQRDKRAIFVQASSEVTVNLCDCVGGGIVTNTNTSASGVIDLMNLTIFNMYGGTIQGYGRGVYVGGTSAFNMYGGNITNCENEDAALFLGAKSSANIYGGKIKDNKTCGVYCYEGSKISVHNNAVISNNTKGDVYLNKGNTITVGTLTGNADIGITSADSGNDVVVTGDTSADNLKYLHSDDSNRILMHKDGKIYLHKHSYAPATCVAPPTCSCGETNGTKDNTNHEYSSDCDDTCNRCGGHRDISVAHDFENGICSLCGGYQPAEKNSNGCYEIGNLAQLCWFSQQVSDGNITSHSAILTADITIDNSVVWKPITLKDNCESTFDGKGHTITFANTKEGSTFGLFTSYNYSTISNLYLKGRITCNQSDLMGALVNSGYRTTVKNVISTVSITNSGNASTGGLFGRLGGKNEQAMIKNCAVYADISSAGRAGGLIGENWGGTQHCFVQNSAYMGDVSGSTAGAIMGYNGLQSNCYSRFTDVYYCEKDGLGYLGGTYGGTITANRVESKTAEQFRSGEVAYLLNNGVTDKTQVWYQTCKTDSYPKFKGDTVYRGYVCGSGSSNPIYANSMDGLIIKESPEHIYDKTGFCENCKSPKPADFDKTENAYKIYSLGELKWFADKVNGGETAVNGKLMNDIDATSLSYLGIGKDASHAFAGTFDGNNKTLKIALVSTEQYVAPFLYVNGATIKNLTVSGTIKTTQKFAAGIVGRIENGNANFENCLSFVEIDSTNYTGGDGTHGGLIAVADGGTTTVNNSGFAGSIIGKTTTSCGGIVGWAGSTVKIDNSFVAAKFELQSNSGDTFARNQSKVTVTNCYYLNALSDSMYSGATQATADRFASGEVAYHLQGTQETQIWGQKIGTDKYPTSSTAKVYEDTYNGVNAYRNEIDGNKILLLGADKKSATVVLNAAGTYTIVFADYEDNRLANVETFEVTVDKAQAVRVVSDEDFTLGTGDKIMLWDNLNNLKPMCEAYEVK